MSLNQRTVLLRITRVRVVVFLLLAVLGQIIAYSQNAADSSVASLRGTAKVNGTLVVQGVMVVVVPPSKIKRVGKPVPAKVSNTGEYRIEEIVPGNYQLRAVGRAIKKKTQAVAIAPGNRNVVDLVLERADKRTRVRGKVLDNENRPVPNKKVQIFSSHLPASLCEDCKLGETTSNELGEVTYDDVAIDEEYSFAVEMEDKETSAVRLIASEPLAIGSGDQARIELRMSDTAQRVLTARVLPPLQLQPAMQTSREEVVTIPKDLRTSTVANGEKITIAGVVTRRDSDTFTVRDSNGWETVVRLEDRTSVKARGGFLRSGANYAQTQLLRGLNLKVEGRGNESGELVAAKVRFSESDLRVARAVESRAAPLEDRVTTTEQNAQRLSGQLDELAAVANTAKGGSKAAQETADAAVVGVNTTNERISALDDYDPQVVFAVNFRLGSAELSRDSKAKLDEIATKARTSKAYVLEVSGFSDSTGSAARNRALSQRRADAVIRYIVEKHNIPLRRIVTPYGYGQSNPVAENTSREGRAQNRRVEIKLLVNRGLNRSGPAIPPMP